MERNSKSNSSNDHKIGSKTIRDSSNNNQSSSCKLKDSLNSNSHRSGEDYLSGFSWPPRSYTCSFCKREFGSAQALGGHMNVHRRDRARLMMSPPRDGQYSYLNLNHNPNPNPNFSTPTLVSPSFTGTLRPLVSSPLSSLSSPSSVFPSEMKKRDMYGTLADPLNPEGTDASKKKNAESFSRVQQLDGLAEDGFTLSKKAGIVRLDLEIGLMSDPKEDLDLELRLGYS